MSTQQSLASQTSRQLVLGGARSGKSAYAEQLLIEWQAQTKGAVVYVATSDHRNDEEMLQRVAHHKNRRPVEWRTLEESLDLAKVLAQLETQALQPTAILLDCLTLWMLNLIEADCREMQTKRFLQALEQTRLPIVLVSNEVGLGVVPMGKLSREFVDELGRLHQAVAAIVEQVTFVTAGLPMKLK